ncbi:hypothetical protein BDW22DRAFT_1425325 [Trametopsis cervina]|nr:hypothetical protein BDW22DRAFT_1425325 [Trametopsis cervina]
MASSTRFASPQASPGRDLPPEPVTPDASLRNRWRSPQESPQQVGNSSPASSATISSGQIPRALDSRPSLRLTALQSAHSMNAINIGTPVRKVVIRADSSITTSFDPADKELYDLWAPKR